MRRVAWSLVMLGSCVGTLFAQERSVVSVLDLQGQGASKAELTAVANLLSTAVFETGLVDVIDRSKRAEILSEIEFSYSDCSDEACAIELGKLLSADVMIVGSIEKVGSRLALDLKALDVASSRIVGTYYKLYDAIDDIVENLMEIGGELAQSFTGKMAERRAVLRYEVLVPLTIRCSNEGADVSIDGVSVGKIREGRFVKAMNRDARAKVTVSQNGYYPRTTVVEMVGEQTLEVSLDPLVLHRFGVSALVGGGTMLGVTADLFFIRNWWYLRAGGGGTLSTLDPLLLNLAVAFSSGSYVGLDDRSRIRPFVGIGIICPVGRITSSGLSSPWSDGSASWDSLVSFNLEAGTDVKVAEHLRLFLRADLSLLTTIISGFSSLTAQMAVGVRIYG